MSYIDSAVEGSRRAVGVLTSVGILVSTACGGPTAPHADCESPGGALFALSGEVVEGQSPFSVGNPVSGCVRLMASAGAPGHRSGEGSEILGFRISIGPESWSGTGLDMVSPSIQGLRGYGPIFEVSEDGDSLALLTGTSRRPSDSRRYLLSFTTEYAESPTILVMPRFPTPTPTAVAAVTMTRR